ncbi:SDR family oxidoreductase [Tranquillimonas rosea]|uniref:SDR family oxidoreductase n=1 Tax=Tranquillimonas rosea TaxID=641238 RepID=UPI003BA90D03
MSRTMLITGASSGIGAETARRAMAVGWRVGLFARRRAPLEEIAAGSDDALVLPGDVTDLGALEGAVAEMAARWGRLDVLFNNAGIFAPAGLIDEIDIADWTRSMDVNLTGMFHGARAAFAQMRRQEPQGGRIINNGSLSAHTPRPGSVCYTSTKHAITGLTKTLSLDGRPFDIACGQIDIGNARTPLVEDLIARGGTPEVMDVGDAARSVLHMADLPLEANVQFMTVMATKMPHIGRG